MSGTGTSTWPDLPGTALGAPSWRWVPSGRWSSMRERPSSTGSEKERWKRWGAEPRTAPSAGSLLRRLAWADAGPASSTRSRRTSRAKAPARATDRGAQRANDASGRGTTPLWPRGDWPSSSKLMIPGAGRPLAAARGGVHDGASPTEGRGWHAGLHDRERPVLRARDRAPAPARVLPAGRAGAHGHQGGLRHLVVRGVHGVGGRRVGEVLHHAGRPGRRVG